MGGRGQVWVRRQLASLYHDWWRGLSQGREFSFKASTQGTVAVEETVGQQVCLCWNRGISHQVSPLKPDPCNGMVILRK